MRSPEPENTALHQDRQAEGPVRTASAGRVTTLTIHNEAQRNALSLAVREHLRAALRTALADEACRTVVLTGAGGHFCAGGDISIMGEAEPLEMRGRLALLHDVVRMIVKSEKPVVAAVEGHAAGAGVALAAACDIVVAARTAKFTCGFNRIGLVPDMGCAWLLPMRMGLGQAKLFGLTGRTMGSEEAAEVGLVERVVDEGEALGQAISLAREIGERAPLSNGYLKTLLGRMPRDFDEMLVAELDAQTILFATDDFVEGRTAFMEKRAPRFSGR